MKRPLTLAFILFSATLAGAQTFEQAAKEANTRLQAALAELDTLQQEIHRIRPELGARLDVAEDEVFRLRDQASNAARIKSAFDVEVNQLNNELRNVQDNNKYIQSTLLSEYIRRLDLTIDPSEIPLYRERILAALQYTEDSDRTIDDTTLFNEQLKIIRLSLDRIQNLIGGYLYSTEGIVEGTIKEGKFALIGPVSFFYANDGTTGMTNGMSNLRANIYALPGYAAGIRDLTHDGKGLVPVDTTKGEALLSITHTITLMEEFKLGGFVMYPILTLFALAILIAAYKAIELFRVKPAKARDLQIILDHLRAGKTDAALAHASSVGGPVGELLSRAVQASGEDKEVIEEVLYECIVKTQPTLERFLAFIAVVAATAPLLGLLGTVTGMIKTFKLITIVGTGDARNLSSGISEALITTKWGLIVAIPTLITHALLNRKAKGVVGSMEQAAVGFINGIEEIRGNGVKA
jgi:biopolymer transport protein ExbB